jgi:hypothetical protein
MTSPALLLAQLGADVVSALRLTKGPQVVPLNTVAVSPPATSRATQTHFPAEKEAQLGTDVICPPTAFRGLHVEPLKFAITSSLAVPMAAQITSPDPSSVQLGLEAINPEMLSHPLHLPPLISFTIIVFRRPRAAQIAFPVVRKVHDRSPIVVVVPIETKPLQLARAGCASRRHPITTNQVKHNLYFIFLPSLSNVNPRFALIHLR